MRTLWTDGAPVAQWVKRRPTDLADRVRSRSRRNLLNRKRSSVAHSLSLSTSRRPDIPETLLKRTLNRKSSIHLCTLKSIFFLSKIPYNTGEQGRLRSASTSAYFKHFISAVSNFCGLMKMMFWQFSMLALMIYHALNSKENITPICNFFLLHFI